MIRLMMVVAFLVCGPVCWAAEGGPAGPSLDEGMERLSTSVMKEIATRYFNAEKRPVIRVAVFDFTDHAGNITVGSLYVCNRIRLALGNSPQFHLLLPPSRSDTDPLLSGDAFGKSETIRDRIVGDMKADVYLFGSIDTGDGTSIACQVDLWAIRPPYDDFSQVVNLRNLPESEKPLPPAILSPNPWRTTFSASGLDFFNHVLVKATSETDGMEQGHLGEVVFLSQPMCDDLNLSWQVKADGMVYDVRKESEAGTLRSRTGQMMQSRVKSLEALKELSYIIKNVGLVVKETGGSAYPLEFYILPTKSDFYFVPYDKETGLRFMYLWAKRNLSKNPSPHESGKGWKLNVAEQDYKMVIPLGTHMATATLEPIAESEYGSKKPRSEYVSRFKFDVLPGLNIYVVNYVFRRDRPEIFVRRLDIEGTRDEPVRAVKRITEVYRVYGE